MLPRTRPQPPPLPRRRRRVHDGQNAGLVIAGADTKGRLEGCDIAGDKKAGVLIQEGADPSLSLSK